MASYLCNAASRQLSKSILSKSLIKNVAAYHGRARIGNREVVGYGINGSYSYIDRVDFPMPAIRFKESTAETQALREKEKGDWKNLTLDEKKELYRYTFCLTFAEQRAPNGDWKYMIGGFLTFFSLALWAVFLLNKYVYPPRGYSMNDEHQAKMLDAMIQLRVDPIEGISSKYDYEKNRWKD